MRDRAGMFLGCREWPRDTNLLHLNPFLRDSCAIARREKHDQEQPMLNLRYVVVDDECRWRIIRGGRRFPETYPTKSQAISGAIALAEKDGLAGRRAEVMVRHENGLFITEWVFGEDVGTSQTTAHPVLLHGST